ncbi:hypothetical protein V6N12_068860 [Hibiscus sabdariffa]|uniref:Uncharacterized protein n=1 Tax=Hibiscus sabdariffa TaxID=183260 RepID=A0ABR2CA17_9ROSI
MVSGCLGWYEPTRHGPGATVALAGRSDEDLGRAYALNGSVTRPDDPMVVNEGIGDDSVALALGGGCGFDVSPWWCGSLLRVGFGEAHNGGRSCVRLELVSGDGQWSVSRWCKAKGEVSVLGALWRLE